MKATLLTIALVLAAAARAPAAPRTQGGVEHFSKEGVSFDYPAGWALEDKSTAVQQHVVLRRPDISALIMVVARREPLQNMEQLFAARKSVTEPYVESLARQLGAKAPDSPDSQCLSVGESLAPGYHLAGRIGQEPGKAEVYPVVKGQRLLHLVYVRHDKDEAAAAPAWKSLVETLKVEPPANPSPEAASMSRVVSGGVLNGTLLSKPQPDYPITAKRARASGTVVVRLTVDEKGEVVSAQAVSGHTLLRAAGEEAARRAKFSPTMLCGKPVKVTGVITYNFFLR
ncbi:MAG TPA: energy transducer TonB [Pyrinomonadaceae bacterium]|jgi:TonB family protein